MKRQNIYKQIALSLLLLVGMAGTAWGQETGEITATYGSEVNVENDNKIKIQALTTNSQISNNAETDSRINLDCLWNDNLNDGNWWAAANVGAVTFQVKPSSYAVINKIFIRRGGKEIEQPSSITLTYKDPYDGTEETQTITGLTRSDNNGAATNQDLLLTLTNPIVCSPYINITLTPEAGNTIALNEIMLYGEEIKIAHRTTKWWNFRKQYTQNKKQDRFDEETEWFTYKNSSVAENLKMQPAHHYTDTIYMRKGETHTLILPDKHSTQDAYASINNKSYRRWYNYRTDGDCSDLLKPIDGDPATYKIENGYLNLPYLEKNNDKIPYKMEFTYPEDGEDSYIIACDVSNYLDLEFPNEEEEEGMILKEPTLSHRVLFYIKAIPSNMETDYYHETYDISFPFTRISDHTLDLVALSKNASAYAFSNDDNSVLTVKITGENTARIKLAKPYGYTGNWFTINDNGTTATLSGDHRIISFAYPNTRTDDTQYVGPQEDDGETDNYTATIEVTKTVRTAEYKIATYNLTFKRNTVLLTQSIIEELETEEGDDGEAKPWDGYKFRTPKALQDNYGQPLRELNWDYGSIEIEGYNENYYPYPMDWSYSTYGFFDGSEDNGIIASTQNPPYPEWGHYGITSGYIETFWGGYKVDAPAKKLKNSKGEESSFHLYVDASDRPGTIARLELPGGLCNGSEIIVSAWVKSAASWEQGGNQDDASALFTIMGVKDGVRTPLYRHCTGQIRNTLYMSDNIPGCGSGSNEWLQVYFSFINEAAPDEYDEYLIQIDNYSASSNGADVYFDDIRCYVAKPTPRVTQKKLTCGDLTLIRMDLDWEQLISRTGHLDISEDGDSDKTNGIDFCFVDKLKYENALTENENDHEKAMEASVVSIGGDNNPNRWYGSLYYDLKYTGNKEYEIEGTLASENSSTEADGTTKFFFYRSAATEEDEYYETGERLLSVDFYADLVQGRDYMMLMRDHVGDGSVSYSTFEAPTTSCAIAVDFEVEGQNLIKMNGEIANDRDGYCTGQIFEFSVNMRYLSDDGTQYVDYTNDDIMYDWFFGTLDEFNGTDKNTKQDEVSLREALRALRTSEDGGINDTGACSEWDDTEQKWKLHLTGDATLDSKYVEVIEKYLNEKPTTDDRLQAKLVLLKKTLEIRILEHGLDLVVAPIDTRDKTSAEANITLCFEPIYLPLKASGKAPQVQPGFEYMDYGEYGDGYNPAMRIGLQQIKDANNKDNPIIVNLRNAKFALNESDYETGKVPDHIGLYTGGNGVTSDAGTAPIYLTNSNDPALQDILHPTDGSEFDRKGYIIGTVTYMMAKPYDENDDELVDNHMVIYFHYNQSMVDSNPEDGPKFLPREGYEYTFTIQIEEHLQHNVDGDATGTDQCQGTLNLTMKVVPEFLVWQGNEIGKNWNNDANWKRADKERLLKGESDTYLTNEDNATDNGYVPMLFSKAIIPEKHIVELYDAGFNGDETQYKNMKWETTIGDLTYMEHPAIVGEDDNKHPIQYDMMVYTDPVKGSMSTKPYRPNLVDQIHFEPGAEMLHAELLTYDTAWVDYKLTKGQWYTLASPLQGIVAGDFYTDGEKIGTDNVAGIENQEYFTPITFEKNEEAGYNNANNNSRFSPSVYQRGWKAEGAKMVGVGEGENDERAVAGNWSAVYNNVYEEYNPGEGFSVKALDFDGDEAIFRLPKNDDSYSYYDSEGNKAETSASPITREGAGKLKISTPEENAEEDVLFTVTNLEAHGDYYLIGNPFMARLDAETFFKENEGLAKTYWYEEDGVQNIAAESNDEWISTLNDATIPPLRSFFVKKADGATSPVTVTFKKDMQVLSGTSNEDTNTNSLILTAKTADGKISRAAVAYDMSANKDYAADEDAELFLDSNLSDVPTIYTVAGTMATSINRTSELYNIPVGIYQRDTL